MKSVKCNLKNCVVLIMLLQILVVALFVIKSPSLTINTMKYLSGDTLDHSGQYRIVRFYKYDGINEYHIFEDVSIATQCSVNHLHHLVELLDRWDGPVSCSVFVPNKDASYADDSIKLLRKCFPKIKRHVIFHLVYPSSHLANLQEVGSWLHLSCKELSDKLKNYGYQNYDVAGILFPHNVLRNAARSGVLTQYVLLLDIDVMPNVGLRKDFLQFATRKSLFDIKLKHKTAYVLPVFEVKKGEDMPKNKQQLLEGVKVGSIRPFHNETCWWCHKTEDFNQWKSLPQSNHLDIGFKTEWDKSWEPFYIAHRAVPMFDERFKQYGFDRIQQICEMHVAGYNFVVLNNAFLSHYGWKFAGKFYANKDNDNAQNWVLFNYHFKDNLLKKYETNRSCSPIDSWSPSNQRGSLIGGRGVINNRFNGLKDPVQHHTLL